MKACDNPEDSYGNQRESIDIRTLMNILLKNSWAELILGVIMDRQYARLASAALIAALGSGVSGCGGGGGGSPAAVVATTAKPATTTPTTTTTTTTTTPTTTTTTPTTTTVAQGNAFLISIPDVTTGTIAGKSPNTGSTVAFGAPGSWSQVANPATNASVPQWVKDVLALPLPNGSTTLSVYARPVSATITGGAGGVPNNSISGQQYVLTGGCTPGTANCGSPNVDLDSFVATQGGKLVDEKTVVAGATPVLLKGAMINQDTWIDQTGKINPWGGTNGLQHSYIGQYSDQALSLLVTGFNSDGGPITSAPSGSVTLGIFYGGNATPAADMTALKNANVNATYNGYFRGTALQTGPMTSPDGGPGTATDLAGQLSMAASFGSGKVGGNIYNMERSDHNGGGIAQPYGVKLDGTMSGSSYSGTAQYTAAATASGAAAISGGPSGQMIGGFFGPNAAETTGVLRIQGTAPGTGPGTGANTTLIGGFGGKK